MLDWTPSPWWALEGAEHADRLAIVFSHIDEPEGRFSLFGTVRDLPAARLFVNTPRNSWYHDGVPGIAGDVPGLAAELRRAIGVLAPRRIATVGVSMGGYAALLFGALVDADRTIAFGPETEVKLPGSRSSRFVGDRPRGPWDDLLPVLERRARPSPVAILSGEADLIDLHCALRVRHLPGVTVRTFRGVGHEVPAALHLFDAFRPLVADFVRDGTLPRVLPLEGRILAADGAAADLLEGHRLRVEGDRVAARARLARCLALYPDADAAHAEMALLAIEARDGRAAEGWARRAARLAPENPVHHHVLGLALAVQARHEEAAAAQRAALAINPRNAAFLFHLGAALAEAGREDEAIGTMEAALAANPTQSMPHFRIGLIHARRGAHAEAEASFRAAVALTPTNAAFHHQLALCLEAQGRHEEAAPAHERAYALNPHNPTLARCVEAVRLRTRAA